MTVTGNAVQAFIQAREDVLRCALEVLTAERHLSEDSASMAAVTEAESRTALVARRLAWAIDGLAAARQPAGWAQGRPDGYILVSPECQQGRHRECDGSPCEHPCHTEDIPGVKP